jgi:esterase FrsA
MAYQWPLDPQELFTERYPQMVNTGLPVADADAMRAAITEMWPDAPGGWIHEWSELAERYAADGRHDLAVLAHGWAKFPSLADQTRRAALARQVEAYQRASRDFPVTFERQILTVPYAGATTPVPVHVLAAPNLPADAPVLLASGGVDSWKMDLHLLFTAFALNTGTRVLALDIPGTGESEVPLSAESVAVIDGLIAAARELGNGTVAHLGISMGGYFSARSGLAGQVDAAIVLGGPVEAAFAADREWQFGMRDIVGNALGFDRPPTAAEIGELMGRLTLRPLLEQDTNAPMLVINGAQDVHVPQHDTLVFQGRRETEAQLLADTGHCATSQLADVVPTMIGWLRHQLNHAG